MRKDIVRLNKVEREIRTKVVQEGNNDESLSVDEIFAQADADLAKLETISEQLKKESQKERKQLSFFQREARSFALFVVIFIIMIVVGIVYFFKFVLPTIGSELKNNIVETQEELKDLDNEELSFEEYLYKKTFMGIDLESLEKSMNNINSVSKYSEIIDKLETDPNSVDLSELTEEERQEFDEFYEKYKQSKIEEQLKQQLNEELNKKLLEEK